MCGKSDEAGFEVLANTDESRTTSAMYTERAYILARGFVERALTTNPGGITDIIQWLYRESPAGGRSPELLKKVIEGAKARISSVEECKDWVGEGMLTKKLSLGATMMLKRTLESLEVI